MKNKYNFGGYATKNDVVCTDGRTIRRDAFKHMDGATIPMVWQHMHSSPENVLGHAILENREDGVYAYGVFNDTPAGKNAKTLVEHQDIVGLSIYANGLVEKAKNVLHGNIRELSLVMSGANPGALIDYVAIEHSDGSFDTVDEEAIIYSGLALDVEKDEILHAEDAEDDEDEGPTVEEVFNTLTKQQKDVVYAIIAAAQEAKDGDMEQADNDEGKIMKSNVFDKSDAAPEKNSLTHAQFDAIMADAQKNGSLKNAFLAHVVTYGIDNIDYLFPDARLQTNTPDWVKRKTEWVAGVINGTHHTPFSRIKSMSADITLDTARAKGYIKGTLKKEEFFALSRRTTTPTTIYKKQKLDRDDIIDITDLDVVAWMKTEMRMMLDEELARAVLIGDGRDPSDDDKIIETNIRPIYKDADFYVHRVESLQASDAEDIIEDIIRAREFYNGAGSPVMYTTTAFLTDMLLIKATDGRRLYATQAELEATLRVAKIVEVPVMTGVYRVVDGQHNLNLKAIIVNLSDYTMGADKGGAVSMFDDFDIDYNQYKYLIETRCSGALVHPKSAIVVEQIAPLGN